MTEIKRQNPTVAPKEHFPEASESGGWQVIYNRDSDIFDNFAEPVTRQTLYDFIDPVIAGVDAYLIDPGAKVQNYFTKAGETYGKDEALWNKVEDANKNFPERISRSQYHKQKRMHLRSLLKLGNPVSLIIDRCHEKGIKAGVSRRMNDCHASKTGWSHLYSNFFIDNPQYWLYPKYADFDFSVKEVRKNTLSLLKEYCDIFDIDILELDFLRHAMYFKPDVSRRKRFRLMNELLEEIREYSLAAGKKRKRNIALQVRVPSTVKGCENVGLDVKTWIKNKWVDALAPSPAFSIEFNIPVKDWKKLTAQSPIKVYPGTDFLIRPEGFPAREPMIEMWRGAFAGYYHAGSDGIHLYNTFCGKQGKDMELKVLETAKNPKLTAGKSKYYLLTLTSQIEWTKDAAMPMRIPVRIPAGKNSPALKIDFPIADDLRKYPPHKMIFRIQIRGLGKLSGEKIYVAVNGVKFSGDGKTLPGYRDWMEDAKDNPYTDPWLEFESLPGHWRNNNQVKIKL